MATKSATPEWILNESWAVSRRSDNWILYYLSGSNWRARSYHPSLRALLKNLHGELIRKELSEPDLLKHVEQCFAALQAAAELVEEQKAA